MREHSRDGIAAAECAKGAPVRPSGPDAKLKGCNVRKGTRMVGIRRPAKRDGSLMILWPLLPNDEYRK